MEGTGVEGGKCRAKFRCELAVIEVQVSASDTGMSAHLYHSNVSALTAGAISQPLS